MSRFPSTLYLPLALATLLSLHGLRRRSLSPGGALAAFCVGFLAFAPPLRAFGTALIAFYLAGSRATKVGRVRKSGFEEGYEEAGYRGAIQVLCNSGSALVFVVLWARAFTPGFLGGIDEPVWRALTIDHALTGRLGRHRAYAPAEWCPIGSSSALSRACLFGALGHFACCLGDTLASELGILSKAPPRLITTLRTVPPGTNGAMSVFGTLASLGGGAFMGAVMFVSMMVEAPACRENWMALAVQLMGWGLAAGGFGSLLDSLLGATVQRTRYSNTSKKILTDDSTYAPTGKDDVKIVSGIGILTNNQVNLVSSITTAILVASMA